MACVSGTLNIGKSTSSLCFGCQEAPSQVCAPRSACEQSGHMTCAGLPQTPSLPCCGHTLCGSPKASRTSQTGKQALPEHPAVPSPPRTPPGAVRSIPSHRCTGRQPREHGVCLGLTLLCTPPHSPGPDRRKPRNKGRYLLMKRNQRFCSVHGRHLPGDRAEAGGRRVRCRGRLSLGSP